MFLRVRAWQREVRSRQVDALLGLEFRRAFGNPSDLDSQTVLGDIANDPLILPSSKRMGSPTRTPLNTSVSAQDTNAGSVTRPSSS
jgi:hypothetical protein